MDCYSRCGPRAATGSTPRPTSSASAAWSACSPRACRRLRPRGSLQLKALWASPPRWLTGPTAELPGQLEAALGAMDEPAAQAVLDRLFSDLTVEAVLRDVLVPYLQRLGERWVAGKVSVAQEHFASGVVRGRLLGLARGWGSGVGPHALLACPPGESHDIGLLMFGIVLHRGGWRVGYFGVDTPLEDLVPVARGAKPDLVVLAASDPAHFHRVAPAIADLGTVAPLLLGGEGAREYATACEGTDPPGILLTDDPVTAAERLTNPALRGG